MNDEYVKKWLKKAMEDYKTVFKEALNDNTSWFL